MALYLVVAHQTASTSNLTDRLREISSRDPAVQFVLLVPATPVKHLLTWIEGSDNEVARQRAADGFATLSAAGIPVTDAVVGPADPLTAIRDEVARRPGAYEAVIISTLPARVSGWLRRDLPSQVRRNLGLPVIQISAREASASADHVQPTSQTLHRVAGLDLRTLAAMREREVHAGHQNLGRIHEVVYDYVSGDPIWVGVASHPLPFRTMLIPVKHLYSEDGRIETDLPAEKIRAQPHVTLGGGFASLSEEEGIYHYFGLTFEMRDIRVLHEGDPLPGSEMNEQQILASELRQPVR